ncbi:alpha-E domain-containing protein [Pantoea sp. 1.19]|uniref:alpha-E domain-containing protein n=1 Tax=Pantoea sp. 1.19 TaxID=1925589 RepID=UPI000948A3EF|nr:alpha-E domain-containing protein [Pantoea sp. 1.19]
MLSRTAAGLYWMARYLERAENIARVLDVTHRLSLLPAAGSRDAELRVPISLTGQGGLYHALNDELSMTRLFAFFALDERNPASIFSCFQAAWNNAHAVRGSLSSEVWESINSTWIEIRQMRRQEMPVGEADGFFDWVKERAHLFRGAMFGTLMRGDAMSFIRLGTLLERADCTARLLDVNQALREESQDAVREYYRLDTLLRAVSAREAYHAIYRQQLERHNVNAMLILRDESPRSLRACIDEVASQLAQIGREGENRPRYLVAVLQAGLRFGENAALLQDGLHAWLQDFLATLAGIAESINHTYLEAK